MILTNRNYLNRSQKYFDSFLLKDLAELQEGSKRKSGASFPAVNITESEKSFEIEIAAPGFKKESFNVRAERNLLVISAQPEEHKREGSQKETYSVQEFSFKAFERRFSFPEDKIDAEKAEGNYENGVLRLILPKKTEKAEKIKKVEIL